MQGLQILIDGFAISTLYGRAALGFTLMFGVSGVLNLSHGGIMVVAAVTAWSLGNAGIGVYPAALLGVLGGLVLALVTYGLVLRPIRRSRAPATTRCSRASATKSTMSTSRSAPPTAMRRD